MTNRKRAFRLGLFIFASALVSLVAAPLIGPLQAQTSEDDIVTRVQQRYEMTRDLEADFTQRATLKTLNETQVSSGKVYIKKPGMMRWDYQEPEPQTILLKSNILSVYTPEFNQLVEQPVTNLYRSKAPIAFLAGQAELREVFLVKAELIDGADKAGGHWRLLLRPKEDNPQLKELQMEIDPKTYDISRSIIIDHFGNETDIRYINIRTNQGIDENAFVLEVPPDVERVKPPSLPLD